MITLFRSNQIYSLEQLKDVVRKYLVSLPQKISSVGQPLKIFRFEFPCKEFDILKWLSQQNNEIKMYWNDREQSFEMGGISVADIITSTENGLELSVFERMEDHLSEGNPHLKYYGAESFFSKVEDPTWEKFGLYRFIVPQFEFYKSGEDFHFAFNIMADKVNEEEMVQIVCEFDKLIFDISPRENILPHLIKRDDSPNREEWNNILPEVLADLSRNKYEKIVLARKSDFLFSDTTNPFSLLGKLKEKTPNCYHFCFQVENNLAFVGASPERLYRRKDFHIEAEAIAGTCPRGKNSQEDSDYKNKLLSSSKDRREHSYVSDAIENSLKPLCQKLDVVDQMSLLELKGGHHLITRFKGETNQKTLDYDLLKALHPTPAVAGTPTSVALERIKEIESFERGWYAAPVGYVGYENVEFIVGIRSGLVEGPKLSLYAGAGIIRESIPSEEWDEIENKIERFINIFDHEPSECKKH